MEVKRVEAINPYDEKQLEMMEEFCTTNHLTNIYERLKQIRISTSENTYLQTRMACSVVDDYIVMIHNHKIIDCCMFRTEKDVKKCFITIPTLEDRRNLKEKRFMQLVMEYAINLGMEEVFVNAPNQDTHLHENLASLGFVSLGADEDMTPFFLMNEEKIKHEVVL